MKVNGLNNVSDSSWAAEWWSYTQAFDIATKLKGTENAPEKAMAVWTAPQNTQRLRAIMPEKILVRIQSHKAELKAFMSPKVSHRPNNKVRTFDQ